MKLISWVITAVVGTVAVVFALSNNDLITVRAWPTPFELDLPLYLLVFIPFVLGFFLGGFMSWWAAGSARGRAREAERTASQEKRQSEQLRDELEKTRAANDDATQKLPAPGAKAG